MSKAEIQEIINCLKSIDPIKIILFGSHAAQTAHKDSDVDLYVVTADDYIPDTYKEKLDLKCRISELLDPVRQTYPVDLLVHTFPMYREFIRLNSAFSREILNHGVVLHEADYA